MTTAPTILKLLRLLGQVVTISLETVKTVKALPPLSVAAAE